MRGTRTLYSNALFIAAFLLATSPASAQDTEKTGIAAGIGLTAATGKTTMGDGSGAIEASLLDSDSVLKAGGAIRTITMAAVKGRQPRRILILGKGDNIDFSMALWVMRRMKDLQARAGGLAKEDCSKKPVVVEQTRGGPSWLKSTGEEAETKKFGFARSDIAAALASDISVGAITLATDDRALIHAIRMSGAGDTRWRDVNSLTDATRFGGNSDFILLSEQQVTDPENAAFEGLTRLQEWTDRNRKCDSDAYKAMIDTIDKFVASVTSAEKGVPAIVTTALLAADGVDALPLILRVAVDDRGGTSIVRSNIWYTLGMPGAAVITSGLKVSFQLSDPVGGGMLVGGMIRCATRPTSYRDVRNMLVTQDSTGENSIGARQERLVTCAYRLS